MMKKLLALLMLCLCAAAKAQEALPRPVQDLLHAAYPGYRIAAQNGWGDDARGQFALVLSKDGENVLCIAENDGAGYAFTVNNPKALRFGDEVPHILLDSTGDAFFYTYGGACSIQYVVMKQDGVWGDVSAIYRDTTYVGYDLETLTSVRDGWLVYESSYRDKEDNALPMEAPVYMPVPVSAAYQEAMALATFDIGQLCVDPTLMRASEGLCEGWLAPGETLSRLDVQAHHVVMLVHEPGFTQIDPDALPGDVQGGTYRIRIAGDDGSMTVSQPLPQGAYLDGYHMGDGTLYVELRGGALSYNFGRQEDGRWLHTGVQGQDGFSLRADGVASWETSTHGRNDGTVYGDAPWDLDLTRFDWTMLPTTFDEAAAMVDPSAYAFVCNPDPADRLHLRASPGKGAHSMGKFYNRTPVRVLDEDGDWAHVRIGSAEDGLEGYMMKAFLTRDDKVACAFPQLYIREEFDRVRLLDAPTPGAAVRAVVARDHAFYLIGVSGDWFVVMTADGTVGYTLQAQFYEGNG